MKRDRDVGRRLPGAATVVLVVTMTMLGLSMAEAQMRSSGFGGGARMPGIGGGGGFSRGPGAFGGGRFNGPGGFAGRYPIGPGYGYGGGRMIDPRDADFEDEPLPPRRLRATGRDPANPSRGAGGPPNSTRNQTAGGAPRRTASALERRFVPGQLVVELDAALTPAQADALARRHRLTRVVSQQLPLIGATLTLFRIADGRAVATAQAQLRADAGVRAVQPNFRYVLQQTAPPLGSGDPAQYALARMRLPEALALADGSNVTVAVIDSGVDVAHPELAGAIAASFDALGGPDGAHPHGTGIAGAIASHARLLGSAPRARILAIRAFGAAQGSAESTSFVILKAIDHAASHGAQVMNMSFAGPQDPLLERGIAAVATRGIVMVAASGNAGPKSPPLYPAANPHVIAVSATDSADRLFAAANRGGHIAVVAPGVDIFLPAPGNKYQMTSGTSFAAAYVSGLAALMIARNPQLAPAELRAILIRTARDLGAPGRDDLFGAGAVDAFGAVSAVPTAPPQAVPAAPAPAAQASSAAAPEPVARATDTAMPALAERP